MHILVVEDQKNIADLIKDGLEAEGFAVDCVHDGETAQKKIELNHNDYDLILMDLMLPKMSGMEVCKNIRQKKISTPLIMLTAKDGAEDIINGLNIGADDYLIKPFSFDVLVARIRAILRRPKLMIPEELKIKGIQLSSTTKKVFKYNKEVKLTLKEFTLLEYLMRHPNQVVNREQILSNVWDFSFDSFSNVVDVHVTNLRKKLEDRGEILETVRGSGYRFNS